MPAQPVDQIRVGDEIPAERDQVGMSRRKDRFGRRAGEPAGGDQGAAELRTQRFGADFLAADLTGKLRICAAVTFARLHLVPRIPAFLAQHPDLEMEVVLDDRTIDLVQEGIDVALRMGRLADSTLTARRIASGRSAVLGTGAYFARHGVPAVPGDLVAHRAVICSQQGGVWTFRRDGAELAVTVRGRLRVTAAEGVRAAVLADAGITIASEWMFAPKLADGTVAAVLTDRELPSVDLWAIFPAGRTATTKARTFVSFVEAVMTARAAAQPGSAG